MPIDINALVADRSAEKYDLYDRHLNSQMVKVLRTIGFDRHYVRGVGAYLYDREQNQYLDLLSGFGAFAVGRNHPTVIGALQQVLTAELPNLVQMDVSLLSGLLADRLLPKLRGLGWAPEVAFEQGLEQTASWYTERRAWWEPIKSGEFKAFYEQQYRERLVTGG